MKTDSKLLIRELAAIAEEDYKAILRLSQLTDAILNRKPSATGWSALECLEHLNLYADYYLPKTTDALQNIPKANDLVFKSGLIGNYLVGTVKIKEGSKKMKTFAAMNPDGKMPGSNVITKFMDNQMQLRELLQKAETANINKGRVSVTFSKLVRLKTGDILRFMVYHNQRHIQQALRVAGN